MKGLLALAIFSFLIFGCIQPAAPTTGAPTGSQDHSFSAISNNSSGTTMFAPYSPLAQHAFQVKYNGNWTDFYANVSLQGSIDYSTWTTLGSVAGNTNTLSFVQDKPVLAVRLTVTGYNASTNSSRANITVSYLGTT